MLWKENNKEEGSENEMRGTQTYGAESHLHYNHQAGSNGDSIEQNRK